MAMGDVADAMGQLFVIERRAMSIKAREFVELQGRPAHDETSPGVTLLFLFRRFVSANVNPFAVLKHGRIHERKRVAIEPKV